MKIISLQFCSPQSERLLKQAATQNHGCGSNLAGWKPVRTYKTKIAKKIIRLFTRSSIASVGMYRISSMTVEVDDDTDAERISAFLDLFDECDWE